jgi:hypothetical protein
VSPTDFDQHDLVWVLLARLGARCRRYFRRGLGHQSSKRLQWRRGGEYSLYTFAPDLGAHKPRPDIKQALVTLIGVYPLKLERGTPGKSESLGGSGQRVHLSVLEELYLLLAGGSD